MNPSHTDQFSPVLTSGFLWFRTPPHYHHPPHLETRAVLLQTQILLALLSHPEKPKPFTWYLPRHCAGVKIVYTVSRSALATAHVHSALYNGETLLTSAGKEVKKENPQRPKGTGQQTWPP